MVLDGFGWFWVVLGRFGWFRVLVTTFFNGIPLGLQDQYLAVRIRYEPQKSILRSSHVKYTFLVRCVARWNHSTCFDAEIVST